MCLFFGCIYCEINYIFGFEFTVNPAADPIIEYTPYLCGVERRLRFRFRFIRIVARRLKITKFTIVNCGLGMSAGRLESMAVGESVA